MQHLARLWVPPKASPDTGPRFSNLSGKKRRALSRGEWAFQSTSFSTEVDAFHNPQVPAEHAENSSSPACLLREDPQLPSRDDLRSYCHQNNTSYPLSYGTQPRVQKPAYMDTRKHTLPTQPLNPYKYLPKRHHTVTILMLGGTRVVRYNIGLPVKIWVSGEQIFYVFQLYNE